MVKAIHFIKCCLLILFMLKYGLVELLTLLPLKNTPPQKWAIPFVNKQI